MFALFFMLVLKNEYICGININVIIINFWVRLAIAYTFAVYEESPGSTGQGCRITSGVGNYRESATETFRRNSTAVVRLKW